MSYCQATKDVAETANEGQIKPAGKDVLLTFHSQHARHDGLMNETAARVEAVQEELQRTGLWDRCQKLDAAKLETESTVILDIVQPMVETLEAAYRQARGDYWNCSTCTFANRLGENDNNDDGNETSTRVCCVMCGALRDDATIDSSFVIPADKSDVYLTLDSVSIALANINATLYAAQLLLSPGNAVGANTTSSTSPTTLPRLSSVFCLTRPPGHHASSESYGSYCLLNTVAVTAQALLLSSSLSPSPRTMTTMTKPRAQVERILIVDWDVHHGDGTQSVIEKASWRNHCKFISIHRHDEHFWPMSGRVDDGHDTAESSIINIPLYGTGYGDADYLYIFESIVLPIRKQWKPDLILVSAGYDCADGDVLGRFTVTPPGFYHMTRGLLLGGDGAEQQQGDIIPTVFVLEGGYDVVGEESNTNSNTTNDKESSRLGSHHPLRLGVAATVTAMLDAAGAAADGATGKDSTLMDTMKNDKDSWRERVRPETIDIVQQVRRLKGIQ